MKVMELKQALQVPERLVPQLAFIFPGKINDTATQKVVQRRCQKRTVHQFI